MLTALFIILMFAVFGKMIIFAFKASWGILKVLLTIIIFPLFLIGLFFSGLVYIALILLLIAGIKATAVDVRHEPIDVHSACRLLPGSGLQLVYILRWRDVLYAPSWKTIL